MEQYYYSSATGQTYSAYQMQSLFGINVSIMDISILNGLGFYPVQPSSPDFDVKLYDYTSAWTIVPISPSGDGAELVFTPVPKPLPEAQANGIVEVKTTANGAEAVYLANNSLSVDVMAAVAGQLIGDRPAALQVYLAEMQVISDQLGADIAAINAATTVDEINNIVNPPTGILNTGRGSGLGPEDLNLSYYTEFNSVSLTEADTELYIPGTATVISYDPMLPPPYIFDSMGNCFLPGDYVMQIRETATSRVIAEFECPLNPSNEDVAF